MAHKKIERAKELHRRRHRRAQRLKARIREAKAAKYFGVSLLRPVLQSISGVSALSSRRYFFLLPNHAYLRIFLPFLRQDL